MLTPAARQLAFHGAVVLLFGLLLGAPYARAIKRGAPERVVDAWRVAHLSLPIGATLMFALAALLPSLRVPEALAWLVAVPLIVSAYAFCVSTPLAALSGQRGLSRGDRGLGRVVLVGNLLGAATSLAAAVALLAACFVAL